MQFAVISDIHANLNSLKAVLKDLASRGLSQIYCAGDLVGYAPFPNQVIEIIKANEIPTVMGNYDDGVGNLRMICGCDYADEEAQARGEESIRWTKENTTDENKEFLRNLPAEIRFEVNNYRILIVHGSPRALNEYIYEDTDYLYLAETIIAGDCDILICGHTHKPFHMPICNKHVINVGSVGKPKHGNPNAVYAIINIQNTEVQVDFIEVPYDVEATAKAIEASALPDEFAEMLRIGQG